MKEKNTKSITNEDLARMIQINVVDKMATKEDLSKMATKEDLSKMATKMDGIETEMKGVRKDINQLTNDVDVLKEGAFTKDEKESVLDMAEQSNRQLRDDTLGRKNITLTRGEYDDVAKNAGFENRFEKIGK